MRYKRNHMTVKMVNYLIRFLFTFLFLIGGNSVLFAQSNNTLDSLQTVITESIHDTTRISAYLNIGRYTTTIIQTLH